MSRSSASRCGAAAIAARASPTSCSMPGADVAGHVLVHEPLGRARGRDADHRRQELVVDPDPGERVLGDVAVVGDDERDRLAHVVDLVLGQRVLRAAVGQRRVRDQQRQRLGHRRGQLGQVVVGPHRVHAVEVEHVGDVDVDDPGVRVRRAEHRGVQRVRRRPRCRRRSGRAAQEALVLDPLDRLAHQLGGHAPARHLSRAVLATSSTTVAPSPLRSHQVAARSRPSRCSGSRCSGRGCRRSCRGPPRAWASGLSREPGGDRGQEARACRSRTAARGTPGTPAGPGRASRRRWSAPRPW